MRNNWPVIIVIIVVAVALIILLFKRNQTDKKHLLNKFTKTKEEGKIDSIALEKVQQEKKEHETCE